MKRTNRFLSILLTLILCVSMFPVSSLTALAAEATNVKYIDENGVEQICSSATIVEDASSKVEWGNGWYVVNEDVTISDTSTSTHLAVNVTGDNVHLILADGCTLTVQGMIYGENGASLTIYRQSLGTGKLDVTTTIDTSVAAIFFKYSSLTINGGTIDVDNTRYSTGGGWGINAEILTINGGTITAKAGSPIESDDEKYYSGTITTIDSSNGNATETKTYCCVKFDTNGGTAVDKVGLEVGSTLNTLPAPTRAGYAFIGWYMPDSSTKVTTATTFSADTTITAKWLEISATPIATAITYGQTLADSALTAGWVWADNTIVPTVANSGYTAYYAIADDTNFDWSAIEGYNATEHRLERTVQITVAKATPIVDPKPTASRVIIGDKLSDSTLTGGVASAPGTFAWKDGTEVLDTAETVTKKVVFTPDDTDNYNTVEMDVDVTVVVCDTTSGEHDYTEQKHDDKDHWYECLKCGNVKADSKTAHTFEWQVDKEPTASKTGLKHEECSCGAKRNVDTVIPKTETNSPQTGDNSNMALLIALLFISGVGLVGTTLISKRKTY